MRHILLGLLAAVVFSPLSTHAQAQQRPAPTTSAAKAPPPAQTENKTLTYVEFLEQLRKGLAAHGVNVDAYKDDIAILSNLASNCPKNMPTVDPSTEKTYFLSPVHDMCEKFMRTGKPGVYIPLIAGSEPKKLYVEAHAIMRPLPASKKAEYEIKIWIEKQSPDQYLRSDVLLFAIILPDLEIEAAKQQAEAKVRAQQKADAAAIEAAQREAEINRIISNAAPDVKLVCLSVDDFIIKYGKTMRVSLNTEKKVVWDSAGSKFIYQATDTHFSWGEQGLLFNLDRTTLRLQIGALFGAAVYQCRKDQPQL
jgi:hypothetical protein